MYSYICQMYYKDRLYSGHYWGDEYSLARARREVVKMQRIHPVMTFRLTDGKTGAIINTYTNKELT
jgi:hypothetical protein